MSDLLFDNDVVIKGIIYNILPELTSGLNPKQPPGVLGTLVYVATERRFRTACDGPASALDRFNVSLKEFEILETTSEEALFAAALEDLALKNSVDLDVGESQLVAIAILRGCRWLCTGDKRAIVSLQALRAKCESIKSLDSRVLQLEALVMAIVSECTYEDIRRKICTSRGTDIALEVCFQCHNEKAQLLEISEGLTSYIKSIQRRAADICGTPISCS